VRACPLVNEPTIPVALPSPSDPAGQAAAVLIDAASGTTIQLPVGTYGWEYPVGP
jgi:hypothetical protein